MLNESHFDCESISTEKSSQQEEATIGQEVKTEIGRKRNVKCQKKKIRLEYISLLT